jgi:2-polyprenyl-3-methyl-5-hydroxy-6-metoxy-1,4-benzoquinol methylase
VTNLLPTAGFRFIRLLPPPGKQTVDVGCGEGRLRRHLKELGHVVVGIDASPSLVAAAREADPSMDILLTDATSIPLETFARGCEPK